MRTLIGMICVVTLWGCSTVDPLTMERTARDLEVYESKDALSIDRGHKKVFVTSRVIAHQRAAETNHHAFLMKAIESSSAQYFSNLGWFRTIDRENGLSVDASHVLKGTLSSGVVEAPSGADFALVVESSMIFIAKQGWKRTAYSNKARGVQIDSDFRLVDIHTKETIFGTKFRSSAECGKGDIRTAISDAADMNVRKFARVVSARYLPPGRVTETRGSGRCARLSIGRNHMLNAKTDRQPATRVDFFEYVRDPNVPGGRPEKVVIAHGTVISADKLDAWVEVDADWIDKATHLATYNVKKGHYVKISEEAVDNEEEVR